MMNVSLTNEVTLARGLHSFYTILNLRLGRHRDLSHSLSIREDLNISRRRNRLESLSEVIMKLQN